METNLVAQSHIFMIISRHEEEAWTDHTPKILDQIERELMALKANKGGKGGNGGKGGKGRT